MKKVFNNILLGHFLAVIGSFIILLFCFQTDQAIFNTHKKQYKKLSYETTVKPF